MVIIHKVLTNIEYRAVSGVFRTIDPPPPLPLASVSSPRTKGWGVPTRRAMRGWGGVNISEDARHWIGRLQYNLYGIISLRPTWLLPFAASKASILKTQYMLLYMGPKKCIYIKSTTVYAPSSEWGLSHPLSRQRVCPSPRDQRGGGGSLAFG
jgi:hypothetical protein